MNAENEIGRELGIDDLVPRKIVVIEPPGHPRLLLTAWLVERADDLVVFFAGEADTFIVNGIVDGRLVDDHGRQVRVFEYLGEP